MALNCLFFIPILYRGEHVKLVGGTHGKKNIRRNGLGKRPN